MAPLIAQIWWICPFSSTSLPDPCVFPFFLLFEHFFVYIKSSTCWVRAALCSLFVLLPFSRYSFQTHERRILCHRTITTPCAILSRFIAKIISCARSSEYMCDLGIFQGNCSWSGPKQTQVVRLGKRVEIWCLKILLPPKTGLVPVISSLYASPRNVRTSSFLWSFSALASYLDCSTTFQQYSTPKTCTIRGTSLQPDYRCSSLCFQVISSRE